MQLLQEQFQDPWAHIACCQLMSRTSGSVIISRTVHLFFALLPTPSAVVDADAAQMREIIQPCGMQEQRIKALKRMSEGFLGSAWTTPSDLYGCGNFVESSWRIFCQGDCSREGVTDPTLRKYLSWYHNRGRHSAPAAAAPEATRDGSPTPRAAATRWAPPARRGIGKKSAEKSAASKARAGLLQSCRRSKRLSRQRR